MGQFPSEDFCCQVMNAENNKTAHYLSCTAFWYALQTSKLISRATPTRICHRSICLSLPSNIILCLFTTAQHICSSSSFCGHLQNYTTSFVCRQPVCSSLIELNSKSNISCHLSTRLRPSHECFLNTMSLFCRNCVFCFIFARFLSHSFASTPPAISNESFAQECRFMNWRVGSSTLSWISLLQKRLQVRVATATFT